MLAAFVEQRRRLRVHHAGPEIGPGDQAVRDGEQPGHPGPCVARVVRAHRLDDRGREAPRLQDPTAHLGVVDAQGDGLLALDRLGLARTADALPVLLAKAHGEDETADVVEHAGREGLVRVAGAEPRGERLGRHPDRHRVRPGTRCAVHARPFPREYRPCRQKLEGEEAWDRAVHAARAGRSSPSGEERLDATGVLLHAVAPSRLSRRYGSTATARSGPPLPPRIFIGSPMNTAPRGGSAARPARFSKMGTLAFVSARWARKSREGPWSIDAVSMPIERMRRTVVSHNAASSPTPGKWRCAVSPGAALPR